MSKVVVVKHSVIGLGVLDRARRGSHRGLRERWDDGRQIRSKG